MAVTKNAFYRLYDYAGVVIRVGSVIRETVLQRTIQNHANIWADANRRVLLHYAPREPAALTGTLTTLLECGVYLSQGREEQDLEIDVRGTDFYIEVEVYDLGGTSKGSVSWTQIGAGTKALTLTPSAALSTGYVRVRAKWDSSGPGEIERIRVLEGVIADVADFASPWKPIDSAAAAANEYLHAVVARRSVENLVQLYKHRQRHAVACWRADDPPRLAGVSDQVQDARGARTVIPFLIPKPLLGTTLTARVRGRAVGHDVTVGVVQAPLRPGEVPRANEDEVTFTAGGAIATEDNIQIDASSWRNDVHLVLLTIDSAYDATGEELEKVGVTPDLAMVPTFVVAEDGSEWSSSGAVVDEIAPYWVEFVDGLQTSTDEVPPPIGPGRRLVLRIVDDAAGDSGGHRLYLWPPIPSVVAANALEETGKSSSGIWVRRHAIGTLELNSVEWHVEPDAVDVNDDWADAMEPGSRTLGLVARRLQTLGDSIWTGGARVHHCGPASDPTRVDPDASLPGAVDKVGTVLDYSTSWQVLSTCVVGDEDAFEVGSGDDFLRSVYVVDALVAMVVENPTDVVGAAGAVRPWTFKYNFRLQLGDFGNFGAFTSEDGTVANGGRLDDVLIEAHVHGIYNQDDPVGLWMGFWPGGFRSPILDINRPPDAGFDIVAPEVGAFCGRGVIPESLWPSLRFQYVRLTLKDSTATGPRQLRLQAQAGGLVGGGNLTFAAPRLHLLTWTVRTLESTDPDAITPT